MPSVAYHKWATVRARALDDVEAAHAAIGGAGRGSRLAAQQITRAYAVLLSAEFQGFCKDLHREAAEFLAGFVPPGLRDVVLAQFLLNRALDRGNPNPGNIGSDFGRFAFRPWDDLTTRYPGASGWRQHLDRLNLWRNAVAHHDYDPARLAGKMALTVAEVRAWRRACRRLARGLDTVLGVRLAGLTGVPPWLEDDAHAPLAADEAHPARFRRGDWVAFTIGTSRHVAEVIEDIGPVGHRQVRFYKVREPMWYGDPYEFEIVEPTLEPATEADLATRYPPEESARAAEPR